MRDSLNLGIHGYSDQVERVMDLVLTQLRSPDFINSSALESSKLYLELSYNILESLENQSTNILKEILKKEFA